VLGAKGEDVKSLMLVLPVKFDGLTTKQREKSRDTQQDIRRQIKVSKKLDVGIGTSKQLEALGSGGLELDNEEVAFDLSRNEAYTQYVVFS